MNPGGKKANQKEKKDAMDAIEAPKDPYLNRDDPIKKSRVDIDLHLWSEMDSIRTKVSQIDGKSVSARMMVQEALVLLCKAYEKGDGKYPFINNNFKYEFEEKE